MRPTRRCPVRRVLALVAVAVVAVVGARPLAAQPFASQDLPPELVPWVPWVLDEVKDLGCARVQGQAVCLWPGRLRLELATLGGSFTLDVHADRHGDLRLPGSAEHWPQGLRLDELPAPVFARDDAPHARVGPGRHRFVGRFEWSRLPESLSVPAEIGLVDLVLEGQPVARPRREKGGLLWLRARGAEAGAEGESLRLQVFRHLADGIPLFVETRILLEVAGRAREITLPAALLPGTAPVAVSGDLPARVEGGTLRVQVRGGHYTVSLRARTLDPAKAFERPRAAADPGGAWPEHEVWAFRANEALRQVELSGPAPIDPSRTELPEEWRTLPAFLMEPGARLAITEVRRGQAEAPPDALHLTREVWLDPSGREASVRDRFQGALRATTRLDLLPPGSLGRVGVDGQDQLVTANPASGAAGVELRRATLQLEADSRLALRGALPAVGWTTGVEQLHATLHLPPGFTLLAATGVDELPGTWTSRFTLLGFFFVLVVTLGVHRLFGLQEAGLALATLVLIHGEPGAPFLVWLSLLAALALRRVDSAGRLVRLTRLLFLGSAAVLLLLLVPFTRDQVTEALFPQVAEGGRRMDRMADVGIVGGTLGGLPEPRAARPPLPQATPPPATLPAERESLAIKRSAAPPLQEQVEVTAERLAMPSSVSASYGYNQALEQDPKAVLQTGPGVPNWTWRNHSLRWSGPVGRDHTMRLFVASPGVNRALTAVRLALLGAFTFVMLTGRWPRWPRAAPRGEASVPVAVLALVLLHPPGARAVEEPTSAPPSQEILEELKRRLTRPAPCEPRCVATPSLLLRLGANRLEVAAEVHAAADGTWAVPGPLTSWSAAELRMDGAPVVAVAHLGDGFLHLRLRPGVHRIEAAGPVPPGDSFTLQFPDPPRRARAEAPGWDVSGLRRDGPAEPSILLTRRLTTVTGAATAEGRYQPWLEVTRTLGFGIRWTVQTQVRRLTPLGAPVAVRIPLLPGEAPTRAGIVVEGGEAGVSLGGDEEQTSFESSLEQSPKLTLRAPEGRPWSEVWRLQCSSIWPCTALGLPPVTRVAGMYSHPSTVPGPVRRWRWRCSTRRGWRDRPSLSTPSASRQAPGAGSSVRASRSRFGAAVSSRSFWGFPRRSKYRR